MDNAGHPGTLLGQGTLNAPTAGAWNDVSLPRRTRHGRRLILDHAALAERHAQLPRPLLRWWLRLRVELAAHADDAPLPSWTTGKTYKDGPLSAYGSSADTPVLVVSPASLSFAASVGGPNPAQQAFGISNGGGGMLSWSAASSASWLSLSPTSGSGPTTAFATATVGGLAAGTYLGTITVSAPGAQGTPQTVSVTLVVTAPDNQAPTPPGNLTCKRVGRHGCAFLDGFDRQRRGHALRRLPLDDRRLHGVRCEQDRAVDRSVVRGHGPRSRNLLLPRCCRGRGWKHQRIVQPGLGHGQPAVAARLPRRRPDDRGKGRLQRGGPRGSVQDDGRCDRHRHED